MCSDLVKDLCQLIGIETKQLTASPDFPVFAEKGARNTDILSCPLAIRQADDPATRSQRRLRRKARRGR